jgi:hypothetical protein
MWKLIKILKSNIERGYKILQGSALLEATVLPSFKIRETKKKKHLATLTRHMNTANPFKNLTIGYEESELTHIFGYLV